MINKAEVITWISNEPLLEDLDDIQDYIVLRRKHLRAKTQLRGKLTFSDILAKDIDPTTKLPILLATNLQAGFQYLLTGGQRKYVEDATSLQMTAECTILQISVDESGAITEFEMAANVAHTIRKGFVRRWICRKTTEFFQQSELFDIEITAELEAKPKKSSKKSAIDLSAVTKATAKTLAEKYLTKK